MELVSTALPCEDSPIDREDPAMKGPRNASTEADLTPIAHSNHKQKVETCHVETLEVHATV